MSQATLTYDLAYLQVVVGLFVFALGLPSLLLGVAVEERVRHLMHRRFLSSTFLLMATLTLLTLLCALCLLWVEKPWTSFTETIGIGRTTTEGAAEVPPPSPGARQSATPKGEKVTPKDDAVDEHVKVAGILLSAYFILALALYWRLVVLDVRSSLVGQLRREIEWPGKPQRVKRAVEDLVALGELGAPGYQKIEVIDAIRKIVIQAIASKTFSQHQHYVDLLRQVVDIATAAEAGPSSMDLVHTARMLDTIRHLKDSDLQAVQLCEQTLLSLAKAAGSRCSPFHAHALLGVLDQPMMQFSFGASALAASNFPVATMVLSRLEASAELTFRRPRPALAGMIALFWTSSEAAKRRAEVFLGTWKASEGLLLTAFREAEDDFFLNGDFATADKIHAFIEERFVPKAA